MSDARRLVEAMKRYRGVKLEQGEVKFVAEGHGIRYERSGYGQAALDEAIALNLVKATTLTETSNVGKNPITIEIWERVETPEPEPKPKKNASFKLGTKERYKSQDNFPSGGHKTSRKKPARKSYIRKHGSK